MTTNYSIGGIWLSVLAAIVVFAITQNVYMAAVMFVIATVYEMCSLIGVIPILGVFVQYWFVTSMVNPWLVSYNFILPDSVSWVVNVAFWVYMIFGGILTVATTIWLYFEVTD